MFTFVERRWERRPCPATNQIDGTRVLFSSIHNKTSRRSHHTKKTERHNTRSFVVMKALLFEVNKSEFLVSIWHKTIDVENQPLLEKSRALFSRKERPKRAERSFHEKSGRKERSALFTKRAAEKSGALFSRKERPKREILENLDSY